MKCMLSCFICVQLFASLWTVTLQAPLSMGFSRQKYWSGWPFPSPGNLPNPVIETGSPALQVNSLPSEPLMDWPYKLVLKPRVTKCLPCPWHCAGCCLHSSLV